MVTAKAKSVKTHRRGSAGENFQRQERLRQRSCGRRPQPHCWLSDLRTGKVIEQTPKFVELSLAGPWYVFLFAFRVPPSWALRHRHNQVRLKDRTRLVARPSGPPNFAVLSVRFLLLMSTCSSCICISKLSFFFVAFIKAFSHVSRYAVKNNRNLGKRQEIAHQQRLDPSWSK